MSSSEVFVAGYFTDFVSTRAAMARLGISDCDVGDIRLHFPLQNWLAENHKLDVLPAVIAYPPGEYDATGVLFMTQFKEGYCNENQDPLPNVHERPRDRAVKEWLVNEAGVPESHLVWVKMWDLDALTIRGFVPKRNNIKGPSIIKAVTKEQLNAYFDYKRDVDPDALMSDFLKIYDEMEKQKQEQKQKEEEEVEQAPEVDLDEGGESETVQ
ncbi:hypothetical protein D9615_007917 [Tricholomella constricta]|uniref:Uncharacterized protein n=1 Tax=Tricholomella constricta TaxID=117010 RepID=A0A8H5H2B2_9AGAR|nr:hypothetical protein D9615_007917 [Tricholomella constricta]